MTTGFWHQVRAVVDRDLLRERRGGDVLWITIPFGALALLLVPLAVTSGNWAIRRLGPQRWRRLHQLGYIAAILGANLLLCEWLVRHTVCRHLGTALMIILVTAVEANLGLIPSASNAPPPSWWPTNCPTPIPRNRSCWPT